MRRGILIDFLMDFPLYDLLKVLAVILVPVMAWVWAWRWDPGRVILLTFYGCAAHLMAYGFLRLVEYLMSPPTPSGTSPFARIGQDIDALELLVIRWIATAIALTVMLSFKRHWAWADWRRKQAEKDGAES